MWLSCSPAKEKLRKQDFIYRRDWNWNRTRTDSAKRWTNCSATAELRRAIDFPDGPANFERIIPFVTVGDECDSNEKDNSLLHRRPNSWWKCRRFPGR